MDLKSYQVMDILRGYQNMTGRLPKYSNFLSVCLERADDHK